MKLRKALLAGATAAAVSVAGLQAPAAHADEVAVTQPAANSDITAVETGLGDTLLYPFKWLATKAFGEGFTMESVTKQITAWVRLLTSVASVFTAVVSISTSVNKLSTTLATGK